MSAFKEHCNQIVKDYIQTVLIIDDMACWDNQQEVENVIIDEPADSSNPFAVDEAADSSNPFAVDEPVDSSNPFAVDEPADSSNPFAVDEPADSSNSDSVDSREERSHSLEALTITDAFYNSGIIAGLYQPRLTDQNEEEFANSIEKVALAADVIILDWLLKDGNSNYSKALVKKVLDTDKNSGGRMRTIIIYTGTPNLNKIIDELVIYLKLDHSAIHPTDYKIVFDNLLISFYNKSNSNGVLGREVAGEDLPSIVITEFASLIDGIVPAFAVKATSEIRKNTGFLLTKFDSHLDAGYLAHRALLPKPEDAELFLLENFVSYLRNMLSISKVDHNTLNYEVLGKWVDNNYNNLFKTIDISGTSLTFSADDIKSILKCGYNDKEDGLYKVINERAGSKSKASKFLKNNLADITDIFGIDKGRAVESSKTLSVLNLFRRTFLDIRGDLPYLTQGSLLQKQGSDEYLICVTPKCDTARVIGNRMFSFAKLKVKTHDSLYDLITPAIDRSNTFVYLETNTKFYDMSHIEFNANSSSRILPVISDELIIFTSNLNDKYIWIGDLEDLDIQSRVSKIVGNLNRVGTDEVEWLRRRSK